MLTGNDLLNAVKKLSQNQNEPPMSFSAEELISLTNQKQKMGMKEDFVEKNQRIEVSIDTLAYLVMRKVDLDGMKVLMKDLHNIVENS